MSRRRTGARFVPITISLKPSMVDDIEAMLSPKQSRSAFVAGAVAEKLNGGFGLAIKDAGTPQIMHAFHARVCGCHNWSTCSIAQTLERMLQDEK